MREGRRKIVAAVGASTLCTLCVVALLAFFADRVDTGSTGANASAAGPIVRPTSTSLPVIATPTATATATPTSTATPAPTPTTFPGWIDPAFAGEPYPGTTNGLITFRGNPSRTFHGTGPMPQNPSELWRFGQGSELCSPTEVGTVTSEWCGTGWTGQPAVFDYSDRRWVVFGSYAPAVHFLDAATGERIMADYRVGDLIKGSVTVDPDGFPLVYFGSRDDNFRIVAFDGDAPRELWSLNANAVSPTLWNDDWDSTPLMIDDWLFIGGENSQWHLVKVNRGTDDAGRVTVDPELVFNAPGWDEELLNKVGDQNVSIESSMTISGNLLWFANSGGLVQAWDIGGVKDGVEPERVFRFWTGDDTDATIVVDDEGYVYVGTELERLTDRSLELGQVIKLDPARPDDPVVWSRDIHRIGVVPDGVWATLAVDRDVVYVPTDSGTLYALDRETGATRWQKALPGPLWSSPTVVDNVLVQADCAGVVHGFDVSDTSVEPAELWSVQLPWCIESSPAVWEGVIYVGHRRGGFHAIGDR